MGTLLEFPKKIDLSLEIKNKTVEELLSYWKERNDLILSDFHTKSAYQKAEILETVLNMNFELYKYGLEAKLKGDLK